MAKLTGSHILQQLEHLVLRFVDELRSLDNELAKRQIAVEDRGQQTAGFVVGLDRLLRDQRRQQLWEMEITDEKII